MGENGKWEERFRITLGTWEEKKMGGKDEKVMEYVIKLEQKVEKKMNWKYKKLE